MIIKKLIQIDNPLLKQKVQAVENFCTPEVTKVIKDLIDSMRFHDLVGIAAPQIGTPLKMFITEVRKTKFRNPQEVDKLRIFINPKITWESEEKNVVYEGCGSVKKSQIFGLVKRPKQVKIRAQDKNGIEFSLSASGLLARVIQHEIDHLNGMEFIDKVADKKDLISKKEYLKKIKVQVKK